MKKRLVVVLLLLLSGLGLAAQSAPLAAAAPPHGVAPLLGDVVRDFDPPDQDWLPGHRGVDIAGTAGAQVVAALDGVVSFAGVVAGRPVVSLDHGGLKTTYEPVDPGVAPGQAVRAGEPIGRLVTGHVCPAPVCLHWGLLKGEVYLDPLSLLGGGRMRLITADEMAAVRARAAAMAKYAAGGPVSAAGLVAPVSGVVTDAYGMRLHPIEGIWRFHDGLDIGAACGSAIVAAADGSVTESLYSPSWGYRLVIDHGTLAGRRLTTSYNHALGYTVSPGDHVARGQVIGWVGSTGASTGCHLHFQTWVNGQSTDPASLLP